MTESEWLNCRYAYDMLEFLEPTATPRKLILFACACCRRIWHGSSGVNHWVVENAERYADGLVTLEDLLKAVRYTPVGRKSSSPVSHRSVRLKFPAQAQRTVRAFAQTDAFKCAWNAARESMTLLQAEQCDIIRDIFGNPFAPVSTFRGNMELSTLQLADEIYRCSRYYRMSELAIQLMESGCRNPEMLNHCRSHDVHVRGCWLIDGLLGYS